MKINIVFLAGFFLCSGSGARATEWAVFGPRAVGMGGASVALADGPIGTYWNAASLALDKAAAGVELPVGAHMEIDGSVIQGANDLNSVGNDCPNGPKCTQANINSALAEMNQPGNGARADVGFGAMAKVKNLAVFVNNFIYVGAMPRVDMAPADDTPAAIAAGNNNSKLVVRGISVTEIGVGYGHKVPFVPGLLAGANLKGLVGKVGYTEFQVFNKNAGTSNSLSHFLDGSKQSFQPAIDLGLIWDGGRLEAPLPLSPRVGLSARDINGPRFDQPAQAKVGGEKNQFSLHGNVRAGASISPFSFWHIAADADLTRNLTMIDGQVSRVLALGTEIDVFNRSWINIPLRAGVSRNVAMTGSRAALSGGFGLHLFHVHFDVSGTATPASQSIQNQGQSKKVPASAGAAAEIAVLF